MWAGYFDGIAFYNSNSKTLLPGNNSRINEFEKLKKGLRDQFVIEKNQKCDKHYNVYASFF